MSIKFRCPACSHGIKAPDSAAGKGVRCPQCGEKARVPGGSSAKPARKKRSREKEPSSQDSNAFLENLDLDRIVDSEVNLCQKCATEIPPGETACPNCGFDPIELTTAGRRRKKMAAKGIDPATFYQTIWKDSFKFALAHIGQAFKTGALLSFFFVIASICIYFQTWVATGPPYAFWTLLSSVSVLIPLGWLLHQHLEIIRLTLEKKDKIKKIRFDFALCGMLGLKLLAWLLVYGLPFWIIFGGLGILIDSNGNSIGGPLGAGLALFSILLFTPQAMSHLTMPVEMPGWVFPKVAKTLRITFLPGVVWAVLFLLVMIPPIASFYGGYAIAGSDFDQLVSTHQRNARIHHAVVQIALAEDTGRDEKKQAAQEQYGDLAAEEPADENLSAAVPPLGMGILGCFLLGFASLVSARGNGLFTSNLRKGLDLISSKKELVYQRKEEDDKIRTRKTTLVAPPIQRGLACAIDILLLCILNGSVLGMVYYVATSFDMTFDSVWQRMTAIAIASIGPTIAIALYFIRNESGYEQTSPGKGAMKMFVAADERCQPITAGQATIRFLLFWFVSCIATLMFGNLIALARKDRMTLHDLLSGTQVRMDKPVPKEEKTKA
ncbi:RDD family protein [Rubinisphaera margarita]|uniref:RDD family protein n=1 Tax=Rubinisphaera margarita TaxID=2909586 RepID=UPI001EE83FCF|nr:RDD family protein [Rubinisphaera margarita]MCG6154498.1 RDD family protein [Rubinisphaera margarita]